ncbi:Ig-like domain-containing protein [Actinacidiphila glaucinigra]|uniref:Ig-like domain-containing protein n=1 Tax=Actinacidiphila glaucinigra TaxID=235986 RepID=UPI002DDC2086|nr:Ig-like domain-containing protein [Actinacidiphila glaucinigra]WSD61382.1 Ig-like domain-containing protein [Actinacidiphila glaucinigra]
MRPPPGRPGRRHRHALATALLAAAGVLLGPAPGIAAPAAPVAGCAPVAYAGTGTPGRGGDGAAATAATLHDPAGLATDTAGRLYIADSANRAVRRVTPGAAGAAPVITTFATTDFAPYGLAVGPDGTVYVSGEGKAVSVRPDGHSTKTLLTEAGRHDAVAVAGDRSVYVSGGTGGGLRRIPPGGKAPVRHFPGATVGALAADGAGNVYAVVDGRVRRIDHDGRATPVPGAARLTRGDVRGLAVTEDGSLFYPSPRARTSGTAPLNRPWGTALAPGGRLYVSDHAAHRVYVVARPVLVPGRLRVTSGPHGHATGDVLKGVTGKGTTVTAHSEPVRGVLVQQANGLFSYTPRENFSGTDAFTATITDACRNATTRTVLVRVVAKPLPRAG